ncbi:MAG: N-carbamoyl-L-amino acid hydrolase [uncultured Rubrobacteraceae bacterium]|uniref:N-carbamoyl-L-amino acid hydrolase n=1 Tax=uncultured Rubrobacteraceae bacterium TaxID=349277 RepID=A0A6J4TF03_9ACTN|nr:MAG: N-carbamoyl-L-amino acid hydrolase [uncultured Rubrobacteraceae bacterium]
MVDGGRLWERLGELAEIGKHEEGGVARLSFTPEEREAKKLVASYMREAGLAVRQDAAGNLFGRREGRDPGAPAVLMGSHVDSVMNGGDFDGPLGVLGGIEVLQSMEEGGVQTERPVEVVAFTDEEGARFSLGMIGSRALAGALSPEDLRHEDKNGVSIEEAMREVGLDPGSIGDAARTPASLAAYLELHIEQGRVLEGEDLPVGVVTGIAGPVWLRLSFTGEAGHAGTTPMGTRRDALAAAAEVVGIVEEEATATGSTVGTVGQIGARPGGINIIPGGAEVSLDLRDIDEAVRDRAEGRIRERAEEVCGRRGIDLSFEELQRLPPAPCSEEIRASIAAACEGEGIRPYSLPSGAGHDGMHVAELCPMGMIFVRSKDGISHNPKEWSSREDCEAGCNVLYLTVLDLANGA